jgi:hypothetical protein
MSKLWRSHDKIGFIYYISLYAGPRENTTTTTESGSGDYGRRSHRNNYIVNLFYYQPFLRHKSVASRRQHHQIRDFGKMAKINLINASGEESTAVDTSSFPFVPHKLNLNGHSLTVFLFPSTMAYFQSDMSVLRKYLFTETLNDPLHRVEAYFGENVEALMELRRALNFHIDLSPTSDMGFYGFKVSALYSTSHLSLSHSLSPDGM